jgi:tetratricopeptide (TPR) repeat protein
VAQDDYSKALEYYKEIMKIAPERKIVLFYMATLYEKYYKDLNVPLQYYQKFLDQADETVPRRYKTYALEHMKALKEKLHFQKGKRRKEK